MKNAKKALGTVQVYIEDYDFESKDRNNNDTRLKLFSRSCQVVG